MRKRAFWAIFLTILGISALTSFISMKSEKGTPTPYSLVYPDYFGNRIELPAENPLTREGVALGRMLLCEPLLSKTNTISCASSFIKGMRKDPNGKTLGISPWEKEALVSFLYVLTDSTFLHNPEFSNPHNDTN